MECEAGLLVSFVFARIAQRFLLCLPSFGFLAWPFPL